ncbi:hypothetical protein WAI453_007839 [Rhynchosporium graminicola]
MPTGANIKSISSISSSKYVPQNRTTGLVSDEVDTDVTMAPSDNGSRSDDELQATHILQPSSISSVDRQDFLDISLIEPWNLYGKDDCVNMLHCQLSDTENGGFTIQSAPEHFGSVKSQFHLYGLDLSNAQYDQDSQLQENSSSVIDCPKAAVEKQIFSDTELPYTQCGDVIMDEGSDKSRQPTSLGMSEVLSPKMKSLITGHFQASKPPTKYETSPPEEPQHLKAAAGSSRDIELPKTQPFSTTLPQEDVSQHLHLSLQSKTSNFETSNSFGKGHVPGTLVSKVAGQGNGTKMLASTGLLAIYSPDQSITSDPSLLTYQNPQILSGQQALPAFRDNSSIQVHELGAEAQSHEQQLKNTKIDRVFTLLESSQSFISTSSDIKTPRNIVSCKERKRIAVSYNRPPKITKAMSDWVTSTNWLLDPFREEDDCWFHPSPPSARLSVTGVLRPVGKLQRRFAWKDCGGKHSIALNYGIAVKLINFQMTKQQQDGFINKQWHLSHLCGNWTCLNPVHTTVEPGPVNINRNSCFSHRSGCLHSPKCLKNKKVALGADGKLIDHSNNAVKEIVGVSHFDDFSSPLLLDEDNLVVDDFESSDLGS